MAEEELDPFDISAVLAAELADSRRRSCAPNRSIPVSLALCSTTDQTAQLLMLALTLPPFDTARNSLPTSTPAAVIQALIPCFTQAGIATVRTRRPFASRSARTNLPSCN